MSVYAEKTKVPVAQTRADIEYLLEKHKAKQYGIATDYEARRAKVQFKLNDRFVRFVLTFPDEKKVGTGVRLERAERQKWRALLLVIKGKLESVENGIECFEEAFLANIVMPNDQTVSDIVRPQIGDAYKTGRMPKALAAAPEEQK